MRWFHRRVVGAALIGCGAAWLLGLALIAAWSRRDATGRADAIVVLGAAQYAGRPSPVLQARLDHAHQLWRDGRAPTVVLTGGRRPGDRESEAEAGRRYLTRRGLPADAILLETDGRTTLASLAAAARLLARQPGESAGPPRVLLVSDPFHMLRLDILARLHGLDPLPSPTRSSPISGRPLVVLEYMVRESVALPTDLVQVAVARGFPDR